MTFFILIVKGQGKRKRKHEQADSEADKAKVGHYRELDSAQNLTIQRMSIFSRKRCYDMIIRAFTYML